MLTPAEAHLLARSDLLIESLDRPAAEPQRLPDRIGSCRIVRLLATGGMGVVYEAVQEHPHRTVAVKVLHPHVVMRGRSAARRFEYEAEVLGYLKHPGIAQIFDAGIYDDGTGGSPYFVMEHIENAVPITQWAEAQGLDIRERLELFIKVCDAVHYAHQKGVIHRDLKPENILVGSDVCPKIIDFGIARATNADITVATMQTEVGQLLGTLHYMSPEQCDGRADDLDTRSDVYSLGVVLYELLCGRLPYDLKGSSIACATRIIQEREPARPSIILRSVCGDMETIVMTALAKDREKRYQSTAALADDIRRYLSGEPIEARPPSRWMKVCRAVSRHPVAVTAVVCALMVGGTAASTWLSIYHLRQRPYALTFAPDNKEVRLVSVAGDAIRTWRSERPISAIGPLSADGESIVVLGFDPRASEDSCSIQVFRAHDRTGPPLWSMSLRDDELPDELLERGFRAGEFGIMLLNNTDIFPESRGKEIIAVFGHWMYSQYLLRILDGYGRTLFQFWHDGNITDVQWLPEPQLLIVLGLNGEAYWHQRGLTAAKGADHPKVVFAVQPTFGRVDRDWLRSQPEDAALAAAWYKTISPEAGHFRWRWFFQPLVPAERNRREFAIAFHFIDVDRAVINWKFDHNGNVIPGSLIPGDGFNLWPEAPDPELFIPIDLPPILPEYRERVGPGRPGVPIGRRD